MYHESSYATHKSFEKIFVSIEQMVVGLEEGWGFIHRLFNLLLMRYNVVFSFDRLIDTRKLVGIIFCT